ncbi:hypothetical protein RJ640_024971 [Escallonia rubra]|uniref:Uncharacterized protein n=3 Tax=Escallonia rubra TaxID=112253 RepID=A0AA88UF75_9ASTE|nr:hypothetical protein RJ640_024971 [Escallonia rubra]
MSMVLENFLVFRKNSMKKMLLRDFAIQHPHIVAPDGPTRLKDRILVNRHPFNNSRRLLAGSCNPGTQAYQSSGRGYTFTNAVNSSLVILFDFSSALILNQVSTNEAHPGLNRPMALVDRSSQPLLPSYGLDKVNRSSFPAKFIFGAASSAYQNYKLQTFYDRFFISAIWNSAAKIRDHSTGDVATDSYHRYKEDVKIVKGMGLDAYRFSISWSRVLPRLESYVTLFHWDVPQALEDEYGGFLSPKIVDDFRDFANLCFQRFGDRVKHWITLNEPWTFAVTSYDYGTTAPGRCSAWRNNNCTGGNSGTEPYVVTHNQILAHAAAVKVYRTKYKVITT